MCEVSPVSQKDQVIFLNIMKSLTENQQDYCYIIFSQKMAVHWTATWLNKNLLIPTGQEPREGIF